MQRTTDISDTLHPNVQYVNPIYKIYGSRLNFSGEIQTIKCFEDNSLVRDALDSNGKNKILVVDAGGSKRCAMLGDQLVTKAIKNGWEGILMYGLIRDSDIIDEMSIGIRALGTHPLKSIKKNIGEKNIIVNFSGVTFTPGEYLYADKDGIIIIKEKISE